MLPRDPVTSQKEILPAEALSSGTDLSMAKRELEVLRDAQEAASHRVKVLMGCNWVGKCFKTFAFRSLPSIGFNRHWSPWTSSWRNALFESWRNGFHLLSSSQISWSWREQTTYCQQDQPGTRTPQSSALPSTRTIFMSMVDFAESRRKSRLKSPPWRRCQLWNCDGIQVGPDRSESRFSVSQSIFSI